MKNIFAKISNFFLLSILLPVVYGCGGGGGGSASVGSLFGTSSTGIVLASAPAEGGSDLAMTVYHNPEPATMLLLGSGIMAIGYLKTRKKVQ